MATLKANATAEETKVAKPKKTVKDSNQAYGTGRRKNAVARVWVKPGTGKVSVNKRDVAQYFARETLRKIILQPFAATKTLGQFDIVCTVKGGGCTGQAGAVLHGVARALDKFAPEFHQTLRQQGFLTRDPRVVERKKYGKHKARRSTQFSKR